MQVVQELSEEDFASRLDFATDQLQRIGEDQQQVCALDRSSGSSPSLDSESGCRPLSPSLESGCIFSQVQLMSLTINLLMI